MYDRISQSTAGRLRYYALGACVFTLMVSHASALVAQEYVSNDFESPKIIRRISSESERLEITTNSSRILTLDKKIPKVQVNNPELVAVTPLSATQVQISAKKPGVTQINLWDEDKQIHTIDLVIYGDLRELEFALRTHFPNSSVKVRKYSQSLLLTGFVDSPDHVVPITQMAEDYAPKVITNMSVGGVQQVLLKVKVFEVSRTKLRQLGVDFAYLASGGGFVGSSVSGLLNNVSNTPGSIQTITDTGGQTLEFGVMSGNNAFFGFLDALQQNNIAKILAEPNLVSVSGRPAQFLEGGEIPILVPQSLGTSSIEYKPFGTQIDFLPIVLGNGNVRLEVRPRVSDIDSSIGIQLQNQNIPGFRVRQADTAVEMQAGQTFALAGLIQQKTEAIERGLPYLSDLPVLGIPFRRVQEETQEIELLILVTPEFVDAIEPGEVPQCGPGMATMSPDNKSLYCDGYLEVPNACGPCGMGGCNGGCNGTCNGGGYYQPAPGGGGYMQGQQLGPTPATPGMPYSEGYTEPQPMHGELQMPTMPAEKLPEVTPNDNRGASRNRATTNRPSVATKPYATRPQANYRRQPTSSKPPQVATSGSSKPATQSKPSGSGFIGPVGYDVDP